MNKLFLSPVLAISILLATSALASAATVSHTIYSKARCGAIGPVSSDFCYSTKRSIGKATTVSRYSGRDLAVEVHWAYDAKKSGLVWQIARIKTTCKSTTAGSSVVYTRSTAKSIYKRVSTGRNTSHFAGGTALRTTCPSGTRATSFSFSGAILYDRDNSISGGTQGVLWATTT